MKVCVSVSELGDEVLVCARWRGLHGVYDVLMVLSSAPVGGLQPRKGAGGAAEQGYFGEVSGKLADGEQSVSARVSACGRAIGFHSSMSSRVAKCAVQGGCGGDRRLLCRCGGRWCELFPGGDVGIVASVSGVVDARSGGGGCGTAADVEGSPGAGGPGVNAGGVASTARVLGGVEYACNVRAATAPGW